MEDKKLDKKIDRISLMISFAIAFVAILLSMQRISYINILFVLDGIALFILTGFYFIIYKKLGGD